MSRIEEALDKAITHYNNQVISVPFEQAAPLLPPDPPMVEVNPGEHMLTTMVSPHSVVAEEYRKLKEALIKEVRREQFNNVVLVASANPKEGKTVTTLNLAICLSQEFDYTVLVVEADLRAPSCLRYLGLEGGPGLSDCLEGRAECSQALIRTPYGGLVLLPAGSPVSNPVELISSNRMRQFVQELKHRYPDRFILIDSPPANLFAETRFLASMTDATILVVRERETSIEDLAETAQALDNKIIGIVYNNATTNLFEKKQVYYNGYGQPEAVES